MKQVKYKQTNKTFEVKFSYLHVGNNFIIGYCPTHGCLSSFDLNFLSIYFFIVCYVDMCAM